MATNNDYLLFIGAASSTSGGWHNFEGAYDSLESAIEDVRQIARTGALLPSDWYHVVDASRSIVAHGVVSDLDINWPSRK